jgi:hypothetical protein
MRQSTILSGTGGSGTTMNLESSSMDLEATRLSKPIRLNSPRPLIIYEDSGGQKCRTLLKRIQ